MKAISLWQPWATLMALGEKTIETRSWHTPYRGTLVIHAAKCWNKEQQEFFNRDWVRHILSTYGINSKNDLPFGAALCTVMMTQCVRIDAIVREVLTKRELGFGNYTDGRFAWFTGSLKPFDNPIPYKGAQGFFDFEQPVVKDNVQREVERVKQHQPHLFNF